MWKFFFEWIALWKLILTIIRLSPTVWSCVWLCSQRSLRWSHRGGKKAAVLITGDAQWGLAVGSMRSEPHIQFILFAISFVSSGMDSSWKNVGRLCVLSFAWYSLSVSTVIQWTTLGYRLVELLCLWRCNIPLPGAWDCSSPIPPQQIAVLKKHYWWDMVLISSRTVLRINHLYFRIYSNLWSFYSPSITFYLDRSVDLLKWESQQTVILLKAKKGKK